MGRAFIVSGFRVFSRKIATIIRMTRGSPFSSPGLILLISGFSFHHHEFQDSAVVEDVNSLSLLLLIP